MASTQVQSVYRRDTPREISVQGANRAVPDHMSLAQFEAFPWPEGQHWELLWGTTCMSPSPLPMHQGLLADLVALLQAEIKSRSDHAVLLGTDVRFPGQDSYVCPDIQITRITGHLRDIGLPLKTVPLLVIEALSRSTSANDLGAKRDLYATAGVPEYWAIDPKTGALSVHVRPKDGQYDELAADNDGYVASPFLGVRLRIRMSRSGYTVETAPTT